MPTVLPSRHSRKAEPPFFLVATVIFLAVAVLAMLVGSFVAP